MIAFFHNITVKFETFLCFSEILYIHVIVLLNFDLNSEVSNKKVTAFHR